MIFVILHCIDLVDILLLKDNDLRNLTKRTQEKKRKKEKKKKLKELKRVMRYFFKKKISKHPTPTPLTFPKP